MTTLNLDSNIISDETGNNLEFKIINNQKSMVDKKKELKHLLTTLSFQYSDTPKFPLASGKMSNFYIDSKMTTLFSKGMALIGELVFENIKSLEIKGIGGLTLGADPIANATAMFAGLKGLNLTSFVIRKEPKKHGLKKWIEGKIDEHDRVVIIDDVITTGGSTIQAIEKATESKLQIIKVIILVDREEGGKEKIVERGFEVESLFTKSELLEEYNRLNRQRIR